MIKVPNLEILKALPSTPEIGEQALLEETHELYQYSENGWEKCGNTTLGVSLYEINQSAMSKAPLLSDEVINKKKKDLRAYIDKKHNTYYMLLCHDINYYTLFVKNGKDNKPLIENEVIECIKDIGAPLAMDYDSSNGAYEIWIKNEKGAMACYFFPYDRGVIKCQ